ncbi:hypothetical protein Pcinc_030917 [Petrolisthes cinctipes]|uniref:Uncharacterized protein n=1 Tax=Petrolisthes cinctipes TaxID=88211 RepID=A0AAE1K5M5_PETCI|nr:hypothetical protein Pcinc_030917 [Petrolisthes cinctipes]
MEALPAQGLIHVHQHQYQNTSGDINMFLWTIITVMVAVLRCTTAIQATDDNEDNSPPAYLPENVLKWLDKLLYSPAAVKEVPKKAVETTPEPARHHKPPPEPARHRKPPPTYSKNTDTKSIIPRSVGIGVASVLGAGAMVAAAPFVLTAAGFTAAGAAAGSLAATMMSSAAIANGGAVAAGSTVAVLQSAGIAGIGTAATVALGATGAAVGGGMTSLLTEDKNTDTETKTSYDDDIWEDNIEDTGAGENNIEDTGDGDGGGGSWADSIKSSAAFIAYGGADAADNLVALLQSAGAATGLYTWDKETKTSDGDEN